MDSVLVFSRTGILLHCGGVQIPKPKKKRNRVPEIENRIEPNLRNRNRPSPTLGHVRFTKTGFRSVSYSSETGICKTNWLREIGLTCFIVVSFAKTEMLRRKNGNGNANCEH